MTTVLGIVKDAYRESNLIAIGETPSADQGDEGLTLLNRFRLSVMGTDMGEQLDGIPIGRNNISKPSGYPWYDQIPDNDFILPPNTRMYLNLTSAQTICLDPNPTDGQRFGFIDKSSNLATHNLTINPNGRTIGDATTAVFNTNAQSVEYMYRADLGDWVRVDPLELTDEWPFPEEFDDMFVIGLALRLNPRHIVQTAPETVEAFKRSRSLFRSRYRQHIQEGSELGLVRTVGTKRRFYDDTVRSNSSFDTGYPSGYRYFW